MKPVAITDTGAFDRRAPIRRRLATFGRDRRGASAVEFAFVALPFLALIGGILELGVGAWAQAMLQEGVVEAGRQIYTGTFQQNNAGVTNSTTLLSNFRNVLCQQAGQPLVSFYNCNSVQISIRQASSFASASLTQASGGTNGWNPSFSSYSCGAAGSIMVVQAAVEFPVFFSLLGPGAPAGGKRILQAATVLKVEPYGAQCS